MRIHGDRERGREEESRGKVETGAMKALKRRVEGLLCRLDDE